MIEHRLVAYGTLVPGEPNHHMLENVAGVWSDVVIRGHLGTSRWRGLDGLPAFQPDPTGPEVPAALFESPELPDLWRLLDDFEGPGYRRIPIDVVAPGGRPLPTAYVYEALEMRSTG